MRTGQSRFLRTAVLALLVGIPAGAPRAQDRPPEEALRGIEERGRRLAVYLEAVDACKAKLQEQAGGDLQSDSQIAFPKRASGWHVTFTRKAGPGQSSQGVLMAGEADFEDASGVVDRVRVLEPPGALPLTLLPYQKALQIAAGVVANRSEAKPPFMTSIFKEKDKIFSVYLQSQPEKGNIRFGGDYRVKVSPDGQMVVGIEPLHDTITDVPARTAASTQPTLHMHQTGDVPTDTDVALVLRHPTLAPHLVLTPTSMFRIDVTGRISWLGPNQTPPGPARPGEKGAP